KEKLELIMREEIKHFLEIEQAGTPNMRNGYDQRNLDTQYGRIEGLLVPRDRNGEFLTPLFALINATPAGWRKPLRRFIRKPMYSVVSCTKSATPSAVFGKKTNSKWPR